LHEAAHRRVALACGAVAARSQVRGGSRAGETRHHGVKGLFRRLCITVAGYTATTLYGVDPDALDISKDILKASGLALTICCLGKREPTQATVARASRLVALAEEHAACMLDSERAALEDDAARLLAEGLLPSGETVPG
jgi:hypothetical protein